MKFKKVSLLLGIPFVVMLGFVCFMAKEQYNAQSEFSRLRALGVPTSRSELVRDKKLTASSNEKYKLIYSRLNHTTSLGYATFIRQPQVETYHRKLLSGNTEAIKLLQDAVKSGNPTTFPGAQHRDYELLGALPQVSAFVASYEGRHAEALQWLRLLDAMSEQFRSVPGFARKNARDWNYPPVEQVLLRNVKDDKVALNALASYLESRPPLPPPASFLKLNYLEMDELITIWSKEDKLSGAWRYIGPYGRRARSSVRQTCIEILRDIDFNKLDFEKQKTSIFRGLSKAETDTARVFCQGMTTTLHAAYRNETLRRLELLAAAVLLRRLETKAVPQHFECPPDLLDPLTGNLFSHKKITDGFVVYSVGPNGRYDNGLGDDLSISIQW